MVLSLSAQLKALQEQYPIGKGRITKGKTGLQLEWRQEVQPSKLSRKYRILIRWSGVKDIPLVEVIEPDLRKLSNGKRSPHEFYSKGSCKPCLMFNSRKSSEWTSSMLISETIVPWALEWLFYWELWLSSGEWEGGGVHPGELTIDEYREQLRNSGYGRLTSRGEKG
ncbi:hypothetical protein EF707_06245 [Vibrio fluvialis]|nr:hypothetical protein [Vibrio fluvialis]